MPHLAGTAPKRSLLTYSKGKKTEKQEILTKMERERERGIDRQRSIRVARDKGENCWSFALKALGWPKTTSNAIISLAFGQNL